MRALGALAIGTLLLTPPGSALSQTAPLPSAPPESLGLSGTALSQVGDLLNQFVQEGKIAGGVVAVARRGRLVYQHVAGFQELETRTPMSERSLFRIYSMTRPVTVAAAMTLYEEGRFGLDDPVSRYIPAFSGVYLTEQGGSARRPPAREITVRDLMLHTSGISDRNSQAYRDRRVRRRDIPMAQFLENVVAAPLMEDPGTNFRYGESTTVLGALIEVWSGRTLDQVMEERVLRPLGMVDTGFWVRSEQRARLATVHTPSADGGLVPHEIEDVPHTVRPALLEGTVGLLSTTPDFLRFSQMLLNKGELDGVRLLKPETVELITRNGLGDALLERRPGTMGWALANVNVVMDPASLNYPTSLGEYGWDGTAGTIFWVDPMEDLIIVLMTQSSPANPDSLRQRVKTQVYRALGR